MSVKKLARIALGLTLLAALNAVVNDRSFWDLMVVMVAFSVMGLIAGAAISFAIIHTYREIRDTWR